LAGVVATLSYGVFEGVAAVSQPEDPQELASRHAQRLGGRMLRVLGVELDVLGEIPPRAPGRGRLVIANHRAATDIGVMLSLFGGALVARGDMAHWPLIGLMAARTGTIFVDRGDRRSGAKAIRAMRRRLKSGQTLSLFPEGATFVGDEVQTFQPGSFVAARGLDVEVIPVGIAVPHGLEYVGVSFGAHVARVAAQRHTPVTAVVGEPMNVELGAREQAERCREAVAELVVRARRHQATR